MKNSVLKKASLLLMFSFLFIQAGKSQCPIPNFVYGQNGTTAVQFYDSTINGGFFANMFYIWNFGDNSYSNMQNPTHTYANPGTYYVCLTVGDSTASCFGLTFCDSVTVGNSLPCNASFNYSNQGSNNVAFMNYSYAANSFTCLWNFGDGNYDTAYTPAHTYTSPGSYNVCLTIYDATANCTNTWCSNVSVTSGGGNFIAGNITFQSASMDSATVYLIRYDSSQGTLTLVNSVSVGNLNGFMSQYLFTNVPSGAYLVKAAADSSSIHYATAVPTYYVNSLFWSGATYVIAAPSQNNSSIDIDLIAGVNPGGPGFIGGLVSQGANKMDNAGDPLGNIQIMVLNMNNTPVQYQYSQANGLYGFSNLAYGTYKIYAEVMGKPTTPAIVTLDAAHPFINNINVEINSNYVTVSVKDLQPDAIEGISLFPNPASTISILEVNTIEETDLNILIEDITGRIINTIPYLVHAGETKINIPVQDLQAGMYIIRVSANGKTGSYKLSVTK